MKDELIQSHNQLMKEWKQRPLHKDAVFIKDGIINIDKWLAPGNKKILLLLKEAYGEDSDWDLCDLICNKWKGPKFKIWWTVSYWLYALQKTTKNFIPLMPSNKDEYDQCTELLFSSAVVNIKKSSGKSASEVDDLKNYWDSDKDLVIKQVATINPDIILCGGTMGFIKPEWEQQGDIERVENTEWIYKVGNRLVIDYWHPASQLSQQLCYYTLAHLYQRTL